jgi:hypothetical protein
MPALALAAIVAVWLLALYLQVRIIARGNTGYDTLYCWDVESPNKLTAPLYFGAVGKGVGSWWKSRDLRAAVKKLKNRAADLAGWFVANYRKVVRKELVRKHRDDLDVFRGELRDGENVFKRWVFPNLRSKVLLRAIAELKKDFRLGPLAYYDQLHKQLKTSEGSRGGMLLYAQGRDKMLEIPPLLTCHDDITLWLRAVDRERVKLERRLS